MNGDIEVFGCDIGYYGVKNAVRQFGSIDTASFPSIAVRKIKSSVTATTELFAKQNATIEVPVDDSTFVVDTSSDSIAGSRIVRAETDNFPREQEYVALVLASLIKHGARNVRRLVLGLPLHTMRHAQFLKQRFEGRHDLGEHGVCTVEKAAVIPQPLGALAYLRATVPATSVPDTTVCLVDSGWHTSDLITVEGGTKVDLARSVGRPGGAAIVIREVARLVAESLGERVDNLDRIDRALRLKQPLHVYGKAVDLEPFVRDALHVTYPIAKALITVVGTCEDLVVYSTGGAARYYMDALQRTLGFDVHTVDRPHVANAIGFLLAGEAAMVARRF
jgi:plasmid segregation protein ParM